MEKVLAVAFSMKQVTEERKKIFAIGGIDPVNGKKRQKVVFAGSAGVSPASSP